MSSIPRGEEPGADASAGAVLAHRGRCRSFCFLEREGARWTVFLETFVGDDGYWRGRFSFRAADGPYRDGEIATADLFLQESEAEIDLRARSLGRPLVRALLDSALHTHDRRQGAAPDVRRWFRSVLARHSADLAPDIGEGLTEPSLDHLKSLYESYRVDQIVHLIVLTDADDFGELVERFLNGRRIDFNSRDRLQFAMLVVQELERYLPLPPFEVWVEDYLGNRDTYRDYTLTLHRGGHP